MAAIRRPAPLPASGRSDPGARPGRPAGVDGGPDGHRRATALPGLGRPTDRGSDDAAAPRHRLDGLDLDAGRTPARRPVPGARARHARPWPVRGRPDRARPRVARLGCADGAGRERCGHRGRRSARGHRGSRLGRDGGGDRGEAPARVDRGPRARRRWLGGRRCLEPPQPAGVPRGHRRAARGDGIAWMRSWPTDATSTRPPGTPTRSGRSAPRSTRSTRAMWRSSRARPSSVAWSRRCSTTGPWTRSTAVPVPLLVFVAGAGTADDETTRERELALEDILVARRGCRAARGTGGAPAGHGPQPDALSAPMSSARAC